MRIGLGRQLAAAILAVLGAGVAAAQIFGGGEIAARVNGEPIPLTDVKAVLDARSAGAKLTPDQERAMRRAALDLLVDDVLMRQFLKRAVHAPSGPEVDRVVDELREVLKKQNKSFEGFLREERQTEAQFRVDVATDLQWKAYLANRYPENEARAYFEANRLFFEKVQVKANHILLKLAPNASQTERENLRVRLDGLRNTIKNGQMTFEDAARKYSECPSKERGGDLGYFTYKFMVVDLIARAAFATEVGDVSPVTQTELGLHLLRIVDRTAREPAEFESIRDLVRKTMAQEQNLFRSLLADQRRTAKIEILMQ